RGVSPPEERQRIFGGQVVAQALMAAYKTVGDQICHSLQSYVIRPGDPSIPVLYQVERSRDRTSFATRRVIAIQKGEQIFNMACSFQTQEAGYEHQSDMPETPSPDEIGKIVEAWLKGQPEENTRWWRSAPIEMRAIDPVDVSKPVPKAPQQSVWLRARSNAGDGIALNQLCSPTRPTIRFWARRCGRTASAGNPACRPRASITLFGSTARQTSRSGTSMCKTVRARPARAASIAAPFIATMELSLRQRRRKGSSASAAEIFCKTYRNFCV